MMLDEEGLMQVYDKVVEMIIEIEGSPIVFFVDGKPASCIIKDILEGLYQIKKEIESSGTRPSIILKNQKRGLYEDSNRPTNRQV